MTREEAIKKLLRIRKHYQYIIPCEETIAIDMAIEALKTEPIRCDECIYQRIGGNTTHYYWCDLWDREVDCNNFCSWAERKGGEDE